MRIPLTLAVALITFLPAAAAGQTIGAGTVEVTGVTGLNIANQTISVPDKEGDADFKNATAAAGLYVYLSNRASIGVAGAFSRLSFGAEDSELTATTLLGGPQLRYRLGGEKTALVLVGGGGLTKVKISTSGDVEGIEAEDGETTGWFWEAGADISFMLRDNIAFNLGARYQVTKSKDMDDAEFDTTGIAVGAGFSFFFGRR